MVLTGRKVFLITATAFAIIIGVNLTLAWQAVSTFPGLEVKNSYVASQSFDADRAAQEALGWTVQANLAEGELVVAISDDAGLPIRAEAFDAVVGRATHVADDRRPEFAFSGGAYRAPMTLGDGNWNIRLEARADDGTVFRQRVVLHVK